MAAAMAVVVATGMAANCGYQRSAITAKAAEVEKLQKVADAALDSQSENAEDTEAQETESDSETADKEETVYAKADTAGKVKTTTVTEWLKNPEKGTVSDTSELEDIKNIKGDETWEETSDSGLEWKSEGNDIYYQGTTDKELPVGVKISYQLDGKDISAKELQGKSGKLKIHIQYTNESKKTADVDGSSEELFTPFTMVTAMMLPSDNYENVEIDNGKVISDAEREIVVGMGFPGLNQSLGLNGEDEDFELPEELTITADVKDATVEPTLTVATTEFLQDLDLDEIDDFDDLGDSIDELKDATNQLVDGSEELADGSDQLAEGAATLADGTGSLASGAGTLADGTKSLAGGAGTLKKGTGALASGTTSLITKIPELVSGVTALDDGAGELQAGADSLSSGAGSVAEGAAAVSGGIEKLQEALAGIQSYTATASDTSKLTSAAEELNTAAGSLKAQAVQGTTVTVDASQLVNTEAIKEAIKEQNPGLDDAAVESIISAITANTSTQVALTQEQLQAAIANGAITVSGTDKVTDAAADVSSAAGTIAKSAQAAGQYAKGAAESAKTLKAGADEVASGANQVSEGAGNLSTGAAQLKAGTSSLKGGANTLVAGVKTLSDGVNSLDNGAASLKSGAEQVSSGAETLADGADQLDAGAGTLSEGAAALAEGNRTLADGMAEYKTEAIDKLTDMFDGDLTKLTDRVKALSDMGKDYQSFAGISSEMKGTTRFVIETEGIDD